MCLCMQIMTFGISWWPDGFLCCQLEARTAVSVVSKATADWTINYRHTPSVTTLSSLQSNDSIQSSIISLALQFNVLLHNRLSEITAWTERHAQFDRPLVFRRLHYMGHLKLNTFSLIGLYSVGIFYQPRQTTLHLWDVSEECYIKPI